MLLHQLVIDAAARTPSATAVISSSGPLDYRALDRRANRIGRGLRELGVGPGDRVGVWGPKSAEVIATMQAALRLGAIYIPLDPLSPVARIAAIVRDCGVTALVAAAELAEQLLTGDLAEIPCLGIDRPVRGRALPVRGRALIDVDALSDEPLTCPPLSQDACAYVLYTSGSTGTPKGVSISHRNALAFVSWAVSELAVSASDRLANHAPLHFDLSVFDLYGAFAAGAAVVLVPEGAAYAPAQMVKLIASAGVTIWYSVPSALILMMERGGLLALTDHALRAILFAGEVFPRPQLVTLFERFGATVRLLNLYGPTETNVCTFYEVRALSRESTAPLPIGTACSGDQVWIQRPDGTAAEVGETGEIMCAGPTVMLGYWGHPPTAGQPYATGDLGYRDGDGQIIYVGRRDHMVKLRGHRVELGEVEAALRRHPAVREAAALVIGANVDARLVGFLVSASDAPVERPLSLIEVKRHLAQLLPNSMIVDAVRVLSALPRTRTGKTDYKALRQLAAPSSPTAAANATTAASGDRSSPGRPAGDS
ncbi:MAG: D-alanine--poly(phosphoribitol) ligase [Haliangiales bacterium]